MSSIQLELIKSGNCIFTYNGDICQLISYEGKDEVIEIPLCIQINGQEVEVRGLSPNPRLSKRAGGIFLHPEVVRSIHIPKSVKILGYGCFMECTELQNIVFEEGCILEKVGSNAFLGCTSLQDCSFTVEDQQALYWRWYGDIDQSIFHVTIKSAQHNRTNN